MKEKNYKIIFEIEEIKISKMTANKIPSSRTPWKNAKLREMIHINLFNKII